MHSSENGPASSVRRIGLIAVGVLLLLSFFIPLINRSFDFGTGKAELETVFPNIEFLGKERVSTEFQLFLFFPGLAGLVAVVFGKYANAPVRPVGFIVIGALGILAIVLAFDSIRSDQVQAMLTTTMGGKAWALCLSMAATALLIGGSRARFYAAGSRAAAVLAAVGGGAILVSYLLPTMPGGSLAVGAPFEIMEQKNGTVIGIVILLCMAMVMAAAILAFINLRRGHHAVARKLGNTSFRLVVGSMLLLFVSAWIGLLVAIDDPGEGGPVAITLAVAKGACLMMGIGLAAPLGLSDLLVTRHGVDLPDQSEGMRAYGSGLPPGEREVHRRIHELELLHEEGHLTEEEFFDRKESLEDLL